MYNRTGFSFFRGKTGKNGVVVMITNESQNHFDYGRIVPYETGLSGIFVANDQELDQQGIPIVLHVEKVVIFFFLVKN